MPNLVITLGTFDVPHIGHKGFLSKVKRYAVMNDDVMVVGINSDRFVTEYKGQAPLYTQQERSMMVRSLGYATEINDGPGKEFIFKQLAYKFFQRRMLVIGSDWLGKDYLAQIDVSPKQMQSWDMELIYVPYTPDISTSDIKRRILEQTAAA